MPFSNSQRFNRNPRQQSSRRQARSRVAFQRQSLALQQHQQNLLIQEVESRIRAVEAAADTAELVDKIIDRWPDCPQFVSHLVDRLMAADDRLSRAIRQEVR